MRLLGERRGRRVPRGIESPTADKPVLTPTNVLEALESLLGKSLVRNQQAQSGGSRLLMLETICEYALEQIEASGHAPEVRRRHAVYFAELADAAEPELNGPDQIAWRDTLDADSTTCGLRWPEVRLIRSRENWDCGLASTLVRHWMTSGLYAEGYRALDAGLRAGNAVPPRLRIKALNAAGQLIQLQHTLTPAGRCSRKAWRCHRSERDEHGLAMAVSLLGETARVEGHFLRGAALLDDIVPSRNALTHLLLLALPSLHARSERGLLCRSQSEQGVVRPTRPPPSR